MSWIAINFVLIRQEGCGADFTSMEATRSDNNKKLSIINSEQQYAWAIVRYCKLYPTSIFVVSIIHVEYRVHS